MNLNRLFMGIGTFLIIELFEQEKRVEKGWFPASVKKKGGILHGDRPNSR